MQCHFDSIRLQHAHRRSTYKPHVGSTLQPLFEDFLAHAQIKPVEKVRTKIHAPHTDVAVCSVRFTSSGRADSTLIGTLMNPLIMVPFDKPRNANPKRNPNKSTRPANTQTPAICRRCSAACRVPSANSMGSRVSGFMPKP